LDAKARQKTSSGSPPSGVEYLHEQVGDLETEFKQAIEPILRKHNMERAYLVRVQYKESKDERPVMLAVLGKESPRFLEETSQLLKRLRGNSPLDVYFLPSQEEEAEVRKVASPFFEAMGN
jgi:hypothetical protein